MHEVSKPLFIFFFFHFFAGLHTSPGCGSCDGETRAGQAGQRSPAASPSPGRGVGKDNPRTYRGSRPRRLRLRVGCWGGFPCSAARRGCRGPGWQGQGPARLMDPARSSGAPRSALRDRRGGRVRRGCGDKNQHCAHPTQPCSSWPRVTEGTGRSGSWGDAQRTLGL